MLTVDSTETGSEHQLIHEGGDTIDSSKLTIHGATITDTPEPKLTTGDNIPFVPTSKTIKIVWTGTHDTSYILEAFTVERILSPPDHTCSWVDDQTDGGGTSITVDGDVIDCTVETDEQITVQNNGVIIGGAISDAKELDMDSGEIYGNVTVENVLNVQDGLITGDALSHTSDVKITNGTVEGSITAEKIAEVTQGTTVKGDIQSNSKDVKILDSTVEGSVTANGTVKVQDSTIKGDVYASPSDFDCTNSTINGEDCSSYTPKNRSDW